MPSAVKSGRPGDAMYPNSSLGENIEGIPTGREVAWEPLVDYRRNGVSETIHGAVAWAHGDEVIHSFGGNVLCYGRSMMKPFMLKAFTKDSKIQLGNKKQSLLHPIMEILNTWLQHNHCYQNLNGH